MKRKTTEEFVAAAKNVFNEYDYSKTEYTGTRNKVTITCRIHGDFIKAPGNLIDRKSGCPKCGNKRKGELSKLSTAEFVKKAKLVHGNKYSYEKVEYTTSHEKVTISCKDHGDFEQQAYVHLQNHGCPNCARLANSISTRMSKSTNKPTQLYYVNFPVYNVWKIGCTSKSIESRFSRENIPVINVLFTKEYKDSIEAYFVEAWLLKHSYNDKSAIEFLKKVIQNCAIPQLKILKALY